MAVFGAYAGARSLNEMAVTAWADSGPCDPPSAGDRDYAAFVGRVTRPGYVMIPATDHFGELLRAPDLAVSRAGGTVWELAAAGTPAILVPYPACDGRPPDAERAALRAGAAGRSSCRTQSSARVPELVAELLADPTRLARMRAAMLAMARPDAAETIAEELIALAGR